MPKTARKVKRKKLQILHAAEQSPQISALRCRDERKHFRPHQSECHCVTGLYLVYADDLLVPASRSVPQEWADILFDFDTKALAPYSADFISGYTAEIYQIPLEEASLVARQHTLRAGRSFEQENSLAGKRYRDFIMNSAGMTVDSFKLALLPLWLGSYRYRDENFALAINGKAAPLPAACRATDCSDYSQDSLAGVESHH